MQAGSHASNKRCVREYTHMFLSANQFFPQNVINSNSLHKIIKNSFAKPTDPNTTLERLKLHTYPNVSKGEGWTNTMDTTNNRRRTRYAKRIKVIPLVNPTIYNQ